MKSEEEASQLHAEYNTTMARANSRVNERAARDGCFFLSLFHLPPLLPHSPSSQSIRHGTMDADTGIVSMGTRQIKPHVLLEIGEKRTVKGAAKDPYVQKR